MKALCETTHYNCKTKTIYPPKNFITYNLDKSRYKEAIPVDACLADEIEYLWRKGIRTAGCCCGHGIWLGFIEVFEEDIPKMEQMGYVHYIYGNEVGGAERKDAFIPKSYGHIYDGYYFPKSDEDKENPQNVGDFFIEPIVESAKDKIAVYMKSEKEYFRIFDLLIKKDVKWKTGSSIGSDDVRGWHNYSPSLGLYMIFDKKTKRLILICTDRVVPDVPSQMEVIDSESIQ